MPYLIVISPIIHYNHGMSLIGREFFQMNGLGNRIIVVDLRDSPLRVTPFEAIATHKHYPFDQMMVIYDAVTAGTEAFIKIFNNDGSMSSACGNGTRCVAWLMMPELHKMTIETGAGLLQCIKLDALNYSVDMGEPKLLWHEIPLAEEFADTRRIELSIGPADKPLLHSPAVVNMGNPHAIFFVEDVNAIALERMGSMLENHPIFPEKANISIVSIESKSHITQRVWERGAGITLACGSGACAAVVASHRRGLTGRNVTVSLPGGDLQIEWNTHNRVIMTGPVELNARLTFTDEMFS
jgi:diaminopimelate epimerase